MENHAPQPQSPATSFQVQGSDAGELKIENDRLKTTIMIITQKLKLKDDDTRTTVDRIKQEVSTLLEKNKHLEKANFTLG